MTEKTKPWYENWWAGMDPNDESWRDTSHQKPFGDRERDDARRWAGGQKPSGGWLRRLLG